MGYTDSLKRARFEWDDDRDNENQEKHGVPFELVQPAFLDPRRVIVEDVSHGGAEDPFYCIGQVHDGVITVRFTYRGNVIRFFGAGYWRKGKKIYEKQNKIHG
jgi:hypothetical protein